MRLKITEVFYSLQGETKTSGIPTTFIRLTGCPMRCVYCDTEYAFSGGSWYELQQLLALVEKNPTRYVTVTGGEPLAQKNCVELMQMLVVGGYKVNLETGGALDISKVPQQVSIVLDVKTPGSGEEKKNHWPNLELLKAKDQLKFVLMDRSDYEWAKSLIATHQLAERCEILFSPCQPDMDKQMLADWILEDGLQVRFQVQLHKLLWGDEAGK